MKFHSGVIALLSSLDVLSTSAAAASRHTFSSSHKPAFLDTNSNVLKFRGGDSATVDVDAVETEEEASLEDRVHAAMKKLGLSTPPTSSTDENAEADGVVCKDGVCALPTEVEDEAPPSVPSPDNTESFEDMKARLAKDMGVDENIVRAAIGATMAVGDEPEEVRLDEKAARAMIEQERDAIQRVMEDSEEVRTSSQSSCKEIDFIPQGLKYSYTFHVFFSLLQFEYH